jgi:hypothetical protein
MNHTGANPRIVSYIAVKIYNVTCSLTHFENKKNIFFYILALQL